MGWIKNSNLKNRKEARPAADNSLARPVENPLAERRGVVRGYLQIILVTIIKIILVTIIRIILVAVDIKRR